MTTSSYRAAIYLALVTLLPRPLLAQVTFVEEAFEAGVDRATFGRGSAMVDLDGDDLLDIVAANAGMPNDFFRQRSDHTFEDVSTTWGIAFDERASWGTLVADFDNDGDPDVYFVNGGFDAAEANQLLRNDLATLGVLTDVSAASGAAAIVSQNFGGTALDYDRDGWLDLFLTTTDGAEPCILLRNLGGLAFEDVSMQAGLTEVGDYLHCSAGDYDNDGWMDVGVGCFGGANRLYRNNGDGTFTDKAVVARVASSFENFGLVLEDFDNDGWLDVYLPKYQPLPVRPSELYRNAGDGTFTDVTMGSGMTGHPDMGHDTGDIDGDGFPDIYIGTGHPHFAGDDLLLLVTPDGSGGFALADVSGSSGINGVSPSRSHGIALGDYDQDGFVDIYVNNGGPANQPETLEVSRLWRSQGNANRFAAVRLRGVLSNSSAVGARCIAWTDAGRKIHRTVRVGHGFANTNSPIQRFGVGPSESVTRIEIHWPSGVVQEVLAPPLGEVLEITELDVALITNRVRRYPGNLRFGINSR